ncbi:hypothetical protein A6A19_07645 [Actinobacillus delphinicola]|nr:hypothetical protein [Actinobacillus delphinicola]
MAYALGNTNNFAGSVVTSGAVSSGHPPVAPISGGPTLSPPVGSGAPAGGGGGFPPIPGEGINGLKTKVKANEKSINENKLLIGQVDAKVSGLVSKVAKDSNRIDHVIADNTSNASHIKDNATKIATNKEGITKNKELIGKTDARVSGVVTKVADNTNKIDHVIADTTTNAQNIAKIAKERADVSGVISKVAINTASINNVSARISSNTKAIEANKTAIAENQSRINHLDKREERHMAQLSALAGLFQPYEIGQFYVTGAVGQYRNNTGIALGSGYRLNRNVAFKVGVSMTTQKQDDAAYNAGVYIGF